MQGISIVDIISSLIEVVLLSSLIYSLYRLIIQTRAVQLLRGALYLGLFYVIAYFLRLQTFLWIMNLLAPSLVIALAIIFQPEIRKMFSRVGQGELFRFSKKRMQLDLTPVVAVAYRLAKKKRGALIVLSNVNGQMTVAETGVILDAEISEELLLSIFMFDTVLHDGAVIIENGRLLAAGCVLPLSDRRDLEKGFGTRHRAALGISEISDAVVIVISEEKGKVHLAYQGEIYFSLSQPNLKVRLRDIFQGERYRIPLIESSV